MQRLIALLFLLLLQVASSSVSALSNVSGGEGFFYGNVSSNDVPV